MYVGVYTEDTFVALFAKLKQMDKAAIKLVHLTLTVLSLEKPTQLITHPHAVVIRSVNKCLAILVCLLRKAFQGRPCY